MSNYSLASDDDEKQNERMEFLLLLIPKMSVIALWCVNVLEKMSRYCIIISSLKQNNVLFFQYLTPIDFAAAVRVTNSPSVSVYCAILAIAGDKIYFQ